jgi:hypothetical protein
MADNKFKLLKEGNIWNAPSEDEEKILALHAEIKTLQKQAGKAKKGTQTVAPKKRNADGNQKNKGQDKSKSKNHKPNWMTNSKKPKKPQEAKILEQQGLALVQPRNQRQVRRQLALPQARKL